MKICHNFLFGAATWKYKDTVCLPTGMHSNHLQQGADQLTMKAAGIFTALDHMLVIDKQYARFWFCADIVMLRFFREEKGFAENAVFFQLIQQILFSLFIAAVYRGLTVQDQTNFFHWAGIFHNCLIILKGCFAHAETDTHPLLLLFGYVRK